MGTNGTLASFNTQVDKLNTNFLDATYGLAWLGQKLPPFTTNEVAFLPFQPVELPSAMLSSEVWSTTVETYYTNLTCSPAIIEYLPNGYTFSNGKGCIADVGVYNSDLYVVMYVGWYDNAESDWALSQSSNCSVEFANNFLAIFAYGPTIHPNGSFGNLSATFCETSYSSQKMQVIVNATSNSVQEVIPVGKVSTPADLTDLFNITNFEYILGTGVPEAFPLTKFDFPDQIILQQHPRLQELHISWPVTNMVGFGVGLNNGSIASFSDTAVLQQVFERAHQAAFVSAFSTLTESSENLTTLRPGIRLDYPGAVTLGRPLCIVVEAALGLITILILILWYLSYKRRSNLKSDPASIADIMSLVTYNDDLSQDMHDSNGRLSAAQLETVLAQKKYHLVHQDFTSPRLLPIRSVKLKNPTLSLSRGSSIEKEDKDFNGVRPIEMKLPAGMIFAGLLSFAIAGLVLLQLWTHKNNGVLSHRARMQTIF